MVKRAIEPSISDSKLDLILSFYQKYYSRYGVSGASLSPSLQDLSDLRSYRDQCRVDEGGGGMCHLVTEYAASRWGWARMAVSHLSADGDVVSSGHYVCILPDSAILDATADQFGGPDDIVVLTPEDVGFQKYRMEWDEDYNPSNDADCADVAKALGIRWVGEADIDAQVRNRSERGQGWWLTDKCRYTSYWELALAQAEAKGDVYAQYASTILSGLHSIERSSEIINSI